MAPFSMIAKLITSSVFVVTNCVFSSAQENFDATYGNSPSPFEINVHPSFIEKTVQKAALTRYTVDIQISDFLDGPPRHNVTMVRDYWVDHYDWFEVQDRLNKRYVFQSSE